MTVRPLAFRSEDHRPPDPRPDRPSAPPAADIGADVGADRLPLVVDVEAALLVSPFWQEGLVRVLSERPSAVVGLARAAFAGRAAVEAAVVDAVGPIADVALRTEGAEAVDAARAAGRPVHLAGRGDPRQTAALADRLGAQIVAWAGPAPDGAADPEAAAVAAFGAGGFDLLAGLPDDPLRRGPRTRLVARPPAQRTGPGATARALVKALRVHQWAKNLLVFLPLVLAHAFTAEAIGAAVLAFAAFSLAASSAYALNDLLDLACDRASPTKRHRPFAAGRLTVGAGLGLSAVLALAAAGLALFLPPAFLLVLGVYAATTVAYSTVLKRKLLLDVVALAGLYALRVLGGGAAVAVAVSDWLLMLSVFLFLALALCKRFAELAERERAGRAPPGGRAYRFEDMRLLLPLAAAAAYGSVLVVALYLEAETVRRLYATPELLRGALLVQIYWVSRVLLLANRGELAEDPVVFALKDRTSWLCAAAVAGLMLAAA